MLLAKGRKMARCTLCEKHAVSGNTVSHSQIHTKRKFKPNIQKINGILLCTKCIRTIKKYEKIEHELAQQAEAVKEVARQAEPAVQN